jgi:hypothetical protein
MIAFEASFWETNKSTGFVWVLIFVRRKSSTVTPQQKSIPMGIVHACKRNCIVPIMINDTARRSMVAHPPLDLIQRLGGPRIECVQEVAAFKST